MKRPLAAALGALFLVLAGPGIAKEVPYLSGRVADTADLIPDASEARIEEELRALEERTGAQVAVLTIDSLEDEDLEAYSLRVAQTWGLGREGHDDGVLLLVSGGDRKMRIEVGYGLEGRLTDLQTGRILDGVLRPHFRRGEFGAGMEAGVAAIAAAIEGQEKALPPPGPGPGMGLGERILIGALFTAVVGTFSLIAIFSPGGQGWFLYLFLMPFYLFFVGALATPLVGLVAFLAWAVLVPPLKVWWRRSTAGERFRERWPRWLTAGTPGEGGAGRSFWAGGSFSGGGGGFSGGGGSFGGGGASSSW